MESETVRILTDECSRLRKQARELMLVNDQAKTALRYWDELDRVTMTPDGGMQLAQRGIRYADLVYQRAIATTAEVLRGS